MHADDERLAQLLKATRKRERRTQAALARDAGIPRGDVIRIEAGLAGAIELNRVRAAFEAASARVRVNVFYNGAAADRLLDERHARLVERALQVFLRRGWQATVEVSFSGPSGRGSIDLLAAHRESEVAVVCEIKSS